MVLKEGRNLEMTVLFNLDMQRLKETLCFSFTVMHLKFSITVISKRQ